MIDYRQIARSSAIFNNLSEQEKDALLKDGKIRHVAKKEFLFHHGDPLVNFYIICFGTIQIFRNNVDGGEKTLEILTAKDIICSDKIYRSGGTHQCNAVAVSDVVVLEFPRLWLKESAKKYGDFALNLLALTAQKVQTAELENEHMSTMSVTQILMCFLQKLCLIYDLNPHEFELPYSKKLIASKLGIELETLSRVLQKLKEFGIAVTGSHVAISDFEAITKNVCDHCSVEESCLVYKNVKALLQTHKQS